jgi:hypothetical protein
MTGLTTHTLRFYEVEIYALSAFFMQNGLLASQCQAFVFAYDSHSAYLANRNDGYTAGRVALTNNSGSERNLEVDTGNFYHPQTQFNL